MFRLHWDENGQVSSLFLAGLTFTHAGFDPGGEGVLPYMGYIGMCSP